MPKAPFRSHPPTWVSRDGFARINGDRINGLFYLLLNRVYWGYNRLILTFDPNFQRDIQVVLQLGSSRVYSGYIQDLQAPFTVGFCSWDTHAKTNMGLEIPLWKRRNIYKPPIFWFNVCFGGAVFLLNLLVAQVPLVAKMRAVVIVNRNYLVIWVISPCLGVV